MLQYRYFSPCHLAGEVWLPYPVITSSVITVTCKYLQGQGTNSSDRFLFKGDIGWFLFKGDIGC